jgi:hypothetical protein
MDLDQGWRTERLDLEPLLAGHAAELAPVLDDPALHEFTGGVPLDLAALTTRYTRLAADGWTVLAHIHPGHLASQRVAAAAGLVPTSAIHNGEVCWIRGKTESPNRPGNRHS